MEDILFPKVKSDVKDIQWEDWNGRFERALRMPETTIDERMEKLDAIVEINEDFRTVATSCSRSILDELFIPENERTIRPAVLNGVAGGVKYIMRGILFKVADGSIGPYFGSDEAAAKTYGNELRNVSHFLCASLNVEHKINIHIALQGVIEYKGFRIIAQAKLPIEDESTLKLGTATGRLEDLRVCDSDNELIETCKDIGKFLHLAPHDVGGHTVYTCADLEIHHQIGGDYYALDFARLFPPESAKATTHLMEPGQFSMGECIISKYTSEQFRVIRNLEDNKVEVLSTEMIRSILPISEVKRSKNLGTVFYRSLRPELLQKWAKLSTTPTMTSDLDLKTDSVESKEIQDKNEENGFGYDVDVESSLDIYEDNDNVNKGLPLSSDVFSGFTKSSTDRDVHNKRVHDATLYLIEDVIPNFVDDDWSHILNGSSQLSVVLHESGINVRHLGLIRSYHFRTNKKEGKIRDQVQNLLLFEIVSRTLKQMLRMCLRTTAKNSKSASDVPIKNCVIQFLNLISNTYDEKNVFWTKTLRSHIFSRFGQVALRKEESIRPQLSLKRLIHRLASDCGIVLNLNEEITCSFEFTRSDIVKIEPIFRAMHTTAHAEGQLYSMLAMKRERQQRDPEIVKRLSQSSIRVLEKAVRRFPGDLETKNSLADAHHTLACAYQRERSDSLEDVKYHFQRSRELRSCDVRCSISNVSYHVATLGVVLNGIKKRFQDKHVHHIKEFGFDGNVVSYDVFQAKKKSDEFFIPLAINPAHYSKSENILFSEISRLYEGDEGSTPSRVFSLLASIMNRCVVDYVQKTEIENENEIEKRIMRFSRIHHLALRVLISMGSTLRAVAEIAVHQFVTLGKTTKKDCSNLGNFLWYLLFSSKSWKDANIRKMFMMESFDRSMFWLLRDPKCNYLGVLEEKEDTVMSANRVVETFIAKQTSLRLIMFQDYFVRAIGRRSDFDEKDLLQMYDESNGRPTASMWRGLREETRNIMNKVLTYRDFFRKIDLECFSDDNKKCNPHEVAQLLRNAIERARDKGYLRNSVPVIKATDLFDEKKWRDDDKIVLTWDNLSKVCKDNEGKIKRMKKIFHKAAVKHNKKLKIEARIRKKKLRRNMSRMSSTSSVGSVDSLNELK